MLEERFRNKVVWMTFMFGVFVIWVHSYNAELFAGGASAALWGWVDNIENFISVSLGQAAVPGFFLISSYLFFRNYSPGSLKRKWAGRIRGVFIPYVAWNSLYYLGYAVSTRLPLIRDLVGKAPVGLSLSEYLKAVFQYSYAPIFWYLYQLMFLIVLSPLIYYLVRRRGTGLLYLTALVLAVHFHLDTGHPNTDALLYYSAAAYLAVHARKAAEGGWSGKRAAGGAGGLMAAAVCLMNMSAPGAAVLWTVAYRLILPVSLWLVIPEGVLPAARAWMRQSLYLYAAHYMIVRFVNKGAAVVLGRYFDGPAMMNLALAVYFLMPAIVVCISYWTALFLNRWTPGIWKVLSGGRMLREAAVTENRE